MAYPSLGTEQQVDNWGRHFDMRHHNNIRWYMNYEQNNLQIARTGDKRGRVLLKDLRKPNLKVAGKATAETEAERTISTRWPEEEAPRDTEGDKLCKQGRTRAFESLKQRIV